jgi:hypothetical protein
MKNATLTILVFVAIALGVSYPRSVIASTIDPGTSVPLYDANGVNATALGSASIHGDTASKTWQFWDMYGGICWFLLIFSGVLVAVIVANRSGDVELNKIQVTPNEIIVEQNDCCIITKIDNGRLHVDEISVEPGKYTKIMIRSVGCHQEN